MTTYLRVPFVALVALSLIAAPFQAHFAYADDDPVPSKDKAQPRTTLNVGLQRLVQSSDVVISRKALEGAQVEYVQNPEEVEAGIEPISTTAAILIAVNVFVIPAVEASSAMWAYTSEATVVATKVDKGLLTPGQAENSIRALNGKYGIGGAAGEKAVSVFLSSYAQKFTIAAVIEALAQVVHPGFTAVGWTGAGLTIYGNVKTALDAGQEVDNLNQLPSAAPLPPGNVIIQNPGSPTNDPDQSDDVSPNDSSGTTPGALSNLIRNHNFTLGLQHWTFSNAFVTGKFGPISPPAGSNGLFAVAHTGVGALNNVGSIEQQVNVSTSRNGSFAMTYNFVTMEFPTFVGTQFNDRFDVTISGPSGEKLLKFGSSLNQDQFTAVDDLPASVLEGWVSQSGGQTGWRAFSQGGLAIKKGIYRLRFEVRDVGDDIVDSALLIDRATIR